MAQTPRYERANVQVAQPGGSRGNAGLIAEAQAKSSLGQRLESFADQITGISKTMAADQAGKDAVLDVYKRKQKIADVNAEYNNRPLTEEDHNERIQKIASITEGAEKKFSGVYSRAYNNAATAAYSNQVTVDAKTASDAAMLEANGSSDSFQKQMNAFRDEIVKGAPTPETRIIAELAINQYGSAGYKSLKMAEIKNDEIKRHKSSNSTTTLQSTDVMANIQEGDWVNATTNLYKLQETQKDAVKNGWVNPEDAQLVIDKATENGILSYAKDRFASGQILDGQYFIDNFRKGGKDSEIPTEFFAVDREKVANRMQYLLETESMKIDAKNKGDKKLLEDNSKIVISDAIEIFKSGKLPDNREEIISAIDNVPLKQRHEFEVQQKAFELTRPHMKKSIPEQQAILNSLEANPSSSIEEKEVLSIIKANLKERRAKAKSDPQSLGAKEGLYPQTTELTPDKGMQVLADNLKHRFSNQAVNMSKYGRDSTQVFTDAEASEWSGFLTSSSTTEDEVFDFMRTIEANSKGKANDVYSQLMKKDAGLYAIAGSMIVEKKPDVTKKIIVGAKFLKVMDNPEDIIEFRAKLNEELGNVFSTNKDALALGATLDAGEALYAYAIKEKGFGKAVKTSAMKQIIKDLTNGVAKRNDQNFFLPSGATEPDVTEWIDTLDPVTLGKTSGVSSEQAVKIIQDGKLHSVGPGVYNVQYNGVWLSSPDENGKPQKYRLRYKK